MNFPLQIGRRCFRIVYFRPVLEKIFNAESMNLKTKEGKKKFMAALEGIKDTFRFSSTSKQDVWYRLIILLDRLYEFLNETENYSLDMDEVLFCLDMLKKIEEYLERRKFIPKNKYIFSKLRILASLVHKLPSYQERQDIMKNKNFWVRLTGSTQYFHEFMANLVTWVPPSDKKRESLYRKWNHFIMQRIFDPEEKVSLKTKKKVFGTFLEALDRIVREGTWDTFIHYYLTYLPYFPMEIVSSPSIFRLLEKMTRRRTNVEDWIEIFKFLKMKDSGTLPVKKMESILVKAFKKYTRGAVSNLLLLNDGRTNGLLKKLISLYITFIAETPSKEVKIQDKIQDKLKKELLRWVKKYRLVPGKEKQIILHNLEEAIQKHDQDYLLAYR